MVFDVKAAQAEAEKELAEERTKEAKNKIKTKLKEIASAEKMLKNLRREYAVLLEDIGETA